MSNSIVFGTDGWRGVIARDFTFDNLTLVAHATARYIKGMKVAKPSAVIGYDTRFLSREFATETARILASYGIVVYLTDSISSTPQVSFHTKQKGASLGVVITASHNPPMYSGFKVKASFGGPAIPEQIAEIEQELANLKGVAPKTSLKTYDEYVNSRAIRPFDAKEAYLRYLRKKLDLEAIRAANLKIIYDPMHGAGINFMQRILPDIIEIHGDYNPSFGEVDHPEPIAECLAPLMQTVRKKKADVGMATDGDADRIGMVDHTGAFVDSHRIFMLLMKYLYEHKKRRGAVVKTVSLTSMVTAYCEKKGIPVYETPVGFKYVAKYMSQEKILIGGEESGGLGTSLHIPERDGVFNGLLLLEMMATTKKSLKQLCDELDEEFGPHRYRRNDVHVTEQQKKAILAACKRLPTKLGRYNVIRHDTRDGYKFYVDNGWLLIRASGTEPLIRFYAEAESLAKVNELLEEGLKLK
ncbi:MAG: phosphoglucomutase/phosphomannomutase family protein [Candidatus Kapabacteria bacterium]|nr:phosphoglucomutase/phosphomannomutase family protein [Candidatus Kapabacteria bacterium]